jgi:hypothetical protein
MLDRAPHAVNIETAESFNAAVLDFLAAQAGATSTAR